MNTDRESETDSPSSTVLKQLPDDTENIYTVLYDYVGQHEDELTLIKSQKIKVLSKDSNVSGDEGWWTGINLSDNKKRGLFPSDYVGLPFDSTSKIVCQSISSSIRKIYLNQANEDKELPPHIPFSQLDFNDCIGAGGFSKVYRGFWMKINRDSNRKELVAIKEARVEGNKEENMAKIQQNVLQEAKLSWTMRHPNIIQLKGICFEKPHFCLIMEYAKGGSLGRLLGVRKLGFPPYILIKWALQVSHGMQYLHENSIIHRDLKSSNILLSEDALTGEHRLGDIILKLTDFGLARELQKTTNDMQAAGTYSHMPPEVIKASAHSKASDVWSFGVLLWELLTGEIPYKGIDPLAIAYGVAVNKLSLPIPSTCPTIFSDLIQKCWHIDPHSRSTFVQIIECLTEISNSSFASTPTESFNTMQQDWKLEIQQLFTDIKFKETELKSREEELERISIRQQAYESILRQREQALEEREKELVIRELTVALQQLNAAPPPPEPKKRRRVGSRLLNNFLRSSSHSSQRDTNNNVNTLVSNNTLIFSSQQLKAAKSIDIGTPSDFHNCLSVQQDLKAIQSSSSTKFLNSLNSSPTEEAGCEPVKVPISPPTFHKPYKGEKLSIKSSRNLALRSQSTKSASVDSHDNQNRQIQYQHQIYVKNANNLSQFHSHLSTAHCHNYKNSSNLYNQTDIVNPTCSCADINSVSVLKSPNDNEAILGIHKFSNISTDQSSQQQQHQQQQSNLPPTRKIKRLIYEIGNLLSYVGIGKDTSKHTNDSYNSVTPILSRATSPQQSTVNFSCPTEEGRHRTSPPITSKDGNNSLFTRRSQFKKQTPSTMISLCSNHDLNITESTLNNNENDAKLQNPRNYRHVGDQTFLNSKYSKISSKNSQLIPKHRMLSPTHSQIIADSNQITSHSQSPTRYANDNQIRFKSLTTQLSDDYTNRHYSQQVDANLTKKTTLTHDILNNSITNILSPNNTLSKSNSSLCNHQKLLDVTYEKKNLIPINSHQYHTLKKKQSKSVDASFKKSTLSASSKTDNNQQTQLQMNKGSKSINHSPLIPRRNDYEPVHRVTIQRQQCIHSPSQPTNTIYTEQQQNTIVSNSQNANNSGLNGLENRELLNRGKTTPTVVLNRPATLDLQPFFFNTSKQSEGISVSPISTNEDHSLIFEEHLNSYASYKNANNPHHNNQHSYRNKLDIKDTKHQTVTAFSQLLNEPQQLIQSSSHYAATNQSSNKSNKNILNSSSLSLSSSATSSSVPSSISPTVASLPRAFHMQSQSNSSNTLLSNSANESVPEN